MAAGNKVAVAAANIVEDRAADKVVGNKEAGPIVGKPETVG